MILLSELNSCKEMLEVMAGLVPGGVLYMIVEKDNIVWIKNSGQVKSDIFNINDKIFDDSQIARTVRENVVATQKIPRSVFGQRLELTSVPILNDDGTVWGALVTVIPKLNAVAASFKDFAPILVEMFPEGALLFMTDLTKVVDRQPSKKFDLDEVQSGDILRDTDVPSKVIKTKEPASLEVPEEAFGKPVHFASYPIFSEEDGTLVATLNIVQPKIVANKLRKMSVNMESGLSDISATIQELAASATEIHSNEQVLNEGINEVVEITFKIDEISKFIKNIADQTKMLGLNASIEAARAGENGRGFAVVAEEISKLSELSKSSVPKINSLTSEIKNKVSEAGKNSKKSLDSSQDQAAASEEMAASVEELSALSMELSALAKDA